MSKKELNQEVAKSQLVSDTANVRKRILVLDIIVAIFGMLGFAGLGVPNLLKGLQTNETMTLAIGIVFCVLAGLWLLCLVPICVNRSKKAVGVIYHLWIIYLGVILFMELVYNRVMNSVEVNIFNLIVCAVAMAFALISLVLYCLKSKEGKIGAKYASFVLMIFSAVFVILNLYSHDLVPFLTSFRNLAPETEFMDRLLAIVQVAGTICAIINVILVVGALAGRLVDRGDNLVVIEKEDECECRSASGKVNGRPKVLFIARSDKKKEPEEPKAE